MSHSGPQIFGNFLYTYFIRRLFTVQTQCELQLPSSIYSVKAVHSGSIILNCLVFSLPRSAHYQLSFCIQFYCLLLAVRFSVSIFVRSVMLLNCFIFGLPFCLPELP